VSRENLEGVLRGYEALNRGDLDAAVAGIAADCQLDLPPVLPDVASYEGRDGLRRLWGGWRDSFEGFRMEIEEAFDVGDKVVVMACACGVGKDSGAEVRTPTFPLVWTLQEGQVVSVQAFPTRAAALEELGL
jgi:ketosteroid isomerase-like protein